MDQSPRARSPLLMTRFDSSLIVVDVQEKLIPAIHDHARLTWNVRRLLDGAKILGVPALGTEQYPKGLGRTISSLAERLPALPEKLDFSSAGCAPFRQMLQATGRIKALVTGIEAHVCVQQTVLDLLSDGYQVYVAADAIGSRDNRDACFAIRRMELAGATITTTEATLFEWCETAACPEFKSISALVRERLPT